MTTAADKPDPLSFAQQRLWLLDRLLSDESVYNVPQVVRVTGPLDPEALRRALNEVVRRHEVLRTRFAVEDGQPVQAIDAELDLPLPVEDLRALPESERAGEARRRARAEGRAPFDLARGPLLRARLLRLGETEHWFLLTLHHIATDGWSNGVLWRELPVLYGACRDNQPSPLPELPVQYADYAVWQREWLQGEALEEQLGFWKRMLADLPALDLPTDRSRPPIASHRGDRVAFEIDADLTRRLKHLGRRQGATLFMTLLAAFQVLLYRYTGQEDFAVGVPIAGRRRPELEALIGFFVNMLVLRGDLRGKPSFNAHLTCVRQRALDAYAHQDLPFEKLVLELAPDRDTSRNPLFQVAFALQNTPPAELSLPELIVERVEGVSSESAKFDLFFALTESGGALRGRVDYAVSLFDAATVERMAVHFQTLLASIAGDPEQGIGRLALQSPAERERVLVEWNRTRAAYPEAARIEALFEARAAAQPEHVAVVDASGTLTYAELDARANELARVLGRRGLLSPRRVGVCFERGRELVVSLLAILKAGGAYVPLDPELPAERLGSMLDDAEISLVLTVERLLPRLPAGRHAVLCVDHDVAPVMAQRPGDDAAVDTAEDVAYVMYTSGSTGTAKGVVIPHRAVIRLVRGTDYVQLGPDDVVAHVSNPAFDAATFEIWGALLNGARLVVIPREVVLSPPEFAADLEREGATTLFLTTALFNQMARALPTAFRHCRTVLFGGEAVEPRWVDAVLRMGPPARLLHVYGPTETTTFATWHQVFAVEPATATIPIGRPIANTEAYILDGDGEPVPVGIPGELCIGGPGLARGYLRRPELTAERFVPHPFAADPAARLYRTGDRARYRPDGAIEFLGRLDRQVKLRGHRIEPGEIEAALLRLPAVREAVIVLHGATTDDRRLTAYVVPATSDPPDPAHLWRELRRTLPEYMIPAAFVFLAALPLTSNGKIDRAKLPDPSDLAEQRIGWHVPPRDPSQQVLARIWSELLGVRNVGIHDSFFDLGGHSLLAAQMVDRVERAIGIKVPLTTLFTHSTIEEFARALRDEVAHVRSPVLAINAGGTRPPVFFLHGDFTGGGFFSNALSRGLGPEHPFYVVHPHGLIDDVLPATIEAMAAERLVAVRAVRPHGPYVIGGHCAGALVALEIARLLISDGEEVALVFMIDATAPWQVKRIYEGMAIGTASERPSRRRKLPPAPVAEAPAEEGPAGNTIGRYRQVIGRYVPMPLDVRLLVLRPETNRDMRPTLGWSALSARAEARVLRGDHHTSITDHVNETAATLRACLEDAPEAT